MTALIGGRSPIVTALSRRSSAFAGLWVGQTISSVGSQVSLVAIPLIAVFSLRAGPAEMAVLAALETAPYVVVALPAGLLADHADRRRLLILCDLGRALAMGAVVVACLFGVASIALLAVVGTIIGGLSAVFVVAQQAYLPEILPADRLVKGNQRLEISESGARIVGPGIAAALVQVAGGVIAVGVDFVSYLASAVAIWTTRAHEPAPEHADEHPRTPVRAAEHPREPARGRPSGSAPARERDRGWRAIAEGVDHVRHDRVLAELVACTAVFNLATGMMLAQLVLFATHDLGVGAVGYGLFHAVGNVGFLVGALAVGRLDRRFGAGRILVLASILGAVALAAIAGAGIAVGLPLLLLGRFTGAFSAPLYNVMLVSVRQARSPNRIQARVAAAFRAIDWATAPIGALLSGVLGAWVGIQAVMVVASAVGVASLLLVLRREVWSLTLSGDELAVAGIRVASPLGVAVEAA